MSYANGCGTCRPTGWRAPRRRCGPPRGALPDQIPIADANGNNVGTVSKEQFDRLISTPGHDGHNEMVGVRDRQGRLTGYFASGTGFIPLAIAQAPGFNLNSYRAAHGG